MGSFADWLDHARESLLDSITCQFDNPDPAAIVQEAEQRLIEATGFNFNQQPTQE